MAYQNAGRKDQTEENNPYLNLLEELKRGKVQPVYLILGKESHLKFTAVNRICDAFLGSDPFRDMNTTVMEGPSMDEVITAATTVPFMADRRVVIVKDFPPFFQKEKQAAGAEEESGEAGEAAREPQDLKAFAESLKGLPAENCLIFLIRGEVDKRKSAFKAVSKVSRVLEMDGVPQNTCAKVLMARARAAGRRLDMADALFMMSICGEGIDTLLQEILKLIAYTEGRAEITREDILLVCSQRSEFKVFEMTDALLRGNFRQAFTQLRILERSGEDQIHLISILGEQCRKALYCILLRREHCTTAEIAGLMGIQAFAVDRFIRMGSQYTPEQLRMFCLWCREREYEIKSGRLTGEGALEEIMLRILQVKHAEKAAK